MSDTGDNDQPAVEDSATLVAGKYRPLHDEGLGHAVVPATDLVAGQVEVKPDMSNPYGNDPEVIAAGGRHFAAFNCSGCHAPLGGGGMGPPLSDDKWIYGGAPAQIYLTIVHGRPDGMPSWGDMLPEQTIWELVAYIKSLPDIDKPAEHEGFVPHPPPSAPGTSPKP